MSLCAIKARFGKSLGMKLKFDTDNVVNYEILFTTITIIATPKWKGGSLSDPPAMEFTKCQLLGNQLAFECLNE